MHSAMKKTSLQEFTRQEFLQFVADIYHVVDSKNNDAWVEHFISLVSHPSGSDLIFWPEEGADDSPSGVVAEVERHSAQAGLPCFSDS